MKRTHPARSPAQFLRHDGGATAIEYALIAGGIASAIAATLTVLGSSVTAMWTTISNMFG